MKIVLNEQVSKLVTETDIKCMLKACDKEVLTKVYEPSTEEVAVLLSKAIEEESKKSRTVAKWNSLINEFKSLT